MLFRRIPAALGIAGLLVLPATAAQAETSEQDAAFLKSAHQVNLAEIAASRIAWAKTEDPAVKRLAGAFMIDHIRMDSDLYRTARKLRVSLPDSPTLEQQALAKRYLAAGADTFDEYYIATQLAGHRAVVRMVAAQADEGNDSSVRELAAKAAPVIAHHQHMLRELAAAEGMAGYAGAGGREG
jgi:putative membrane protein